MSSPIRSPISIPGSRPPSTGSAPSPSAAPLVARARRRRGHGYRPAGHGTRVGARRDLSGAPGRAAEARGAVIASGAGTDQPAPGEARTLDDVIQAYVKQCASIEANGSRVILMASRALAPAPRGPQGLPHGLWPRSRPGAAAGHPSLAGRDVRSRLAGYWGRRDLSAPTDVTHEVIARPRRQGRWRQALAARRGARRSRCDADSRKVSHVYRR